MSFDKKNTKVMGEERESRKIIKVTRLFLSFPGLSLPIGIYIVCLILV